MRPEAAALPPRCHLLQLQAGPHLQDGPHLQALAGGVHLQVGVQVQGLHWQDFVIFQLLWLGWWSRCIMLRIGALIERSG